jgi:Txe/YoeB family toxin of Txe-Axe toxin-antitoxin module
MINNVIRDPFFGIRKPQLLKNYLKEWWPGRITLGTASSTE